MEELQEESGLACCICREGYKYHPQKVCCIFGNEAYLELKVYFERVLETWKFKRLSCFKTSQCKIIVLGVFLQVLGIYTFTKRCILEEFENKQRKTQVRKL